MKAYTLKERTINYNDEYEVIVVGGGPSGCAAAAASARRGAKTLLIEATGCLGGMGTVGLVPAWCPFSDKEKIIYKGIAEEVFFKSKEDIDHIKKDDLDWIVIDPEALKRVYDDLVVESGADVLFNTLLSAVEAENGEVKEIIVSNKAGLTAYKARVFVDCTGDADICAWAGAEMLPFEDEGGYQPATLCFNLSGVDNYGFKSGPKMNPANADSPMHAIIASGKFTIPDTHMNCLEISSGHFGFNAGHIWDVDNTKPETVSKALVRGRQLALEFQKALAEFHPKAFASARVSQTAPVLGIRETRRVVGDYVLTIEDYIARKSFDDEICRNCYYVDVHHTQAEAKAINDGTLNKEATAHRYNKGESHGIPYRCLTPKGLKNVLVAGRSISTDRLVQGSTRVMPVCLCMGEAAGKAAAIAKNADAVDVHNIDVALLRKQIIEDGGFIK